MLISLNCLLGCKQLIDLVNPNSIAFNQFLFAYNRIIRCLKTNFIINKNIPIEFDRDKKYMVKVNLIMQMFYCPKNAQYVFFKYFFQVWFFFQAFLVSESKIWLSPQTRKKGLAKNKKRTKTVKPTNQNATLLWLDPILCAKNLCKEGASAQIELLLLYTTTSQYLCQTAVPPIHKPLNLEEYKQPS